MDAVSCLVANHTNKTRIHFHSSSCESICCYYYLYIHIMYMPGVWKSDSKIVCTARSTDWMKLNQFFIEKLLRTSTSAIRFFILYMLYTPYVYHCIWTAAAICIVLCILSVRVYKFTVIYIYNTPWGTHTLSVCFYAKPWNSRMWYTVWQLPLLLLLLLLLLLPLWLIAFFHVDSSSVSVCL